MAPNLDILDSYRQELVTSALEQNDLEHLGTAILEVERFAAELKAEEVDKAINFAEILLKLERAKWLLDNPSTKTPHSSSSQDSSSPTL